ncbi:MAG: LysR family transcriptional regulator [Bdellovibrionales bacterium]|nr:LysR family transcriptional regulator [Bdellovibrionales bacterium]
MDNWINYHHLFYFKTIAEEGTVSKAAVKLRLGQPTLSAQLKQFEENLGVQLFERQKKRLVLTEHGKVALDYSKNIFRMGGEMYEVLHDRLRPARPALHLGALDSVPKQIVLQLVQRAQKIAACHITLSEGNSDELLRQLGTHQMDIMVTNFLPSGVNAKGILVKPITKKPVAFYGSPKYKSLRNGFPSSISGQPMIFPTFDSRLRQDLESWARAYDVELDLVIESQDIAVKKLMAINGMGIMPTATHTVMGQVLRGELIEIGKLVGVHEELYLLSAKRKIENHIAAKLMSSFSI